MSLARSKLLAILHNMKSPVLFDQTSYKKIMGHGFLAYLQQLLTKSSGNCLELLNPRKKGARKSYANLVSGVLSLLYVLDLLRSLNLLF